MATKASEFPQEELPSDTTNNRVLTCPEIKTLDNIPPADTSNHEPKDEVTSVFEHWVATCRNTGRGRTPVLGDKRRRVIVKALKMYDHQKCIDAIDGINMSEFHQGANPRGKKYDDITLILRDEKHIEMFADMATDINEEWANE